MDPIRDVSILPQANIYFDGKCISHTIETASGERKSVGVILPATLTFSTGAPELMEIAAGRCQVRLEGEKDWREYIAGESFAVAADSGFDIEVSETLHYVCHFG